MRSNILYDGTLLSERRDFTVICMKDLHLLAGNLSLLKKIDGLSVYVCLFAALLQALIGSKCFKYISFSLV